MSTVPQTSPANLVTMDPTFRFTRVNDEAASSISMTPGRTSQSQVSTEATGAKPDVASRLPFDVLSQIFEDYLAQETPSYPIETLLRVCRSWSQVALDCPRLWSTFKMRCDELTYWNRRICQRLLRCPSDCPLDIEMSSERNLAFTPGPTIESVFQTLTGPEGKDALRWRKFKVNDDNRQLYDKAGCSIIGKFCGNPTPNLRELEVYNVVSSRQIFPVTPSLRVFSNFNVHLHSFPDVTSATELDISMDVGFQRALSEASNVVKLKVKLDNFGNGQYRLTAPYERLTTLHLCPGLDEGCLDGFSAPALQELSLSLARGSEFQEVASCKGIPFHQVKTILIEHEYHLHYSVAGTGSYCEGPYCEGLSQFLCLVNSLEVWEPRDETTQELALKLPTRYHPQPCRESIFLLTVRGYKLNLGRGKDRLATVARLRACRSNNVPNDTWIEILEDLENNWA